MTDQEIFDNARTKAFGRCLIAAQRVGGVGPPPPPGRPNPLTHERQRAQRIAQRIFNRDEVDLDKIAEVLDEMKNWLATPTLPIERAAPDDKNCGQRAGYVAKNRPPIRLCPAFFAASEEQQIRTMLHEAAHLAGIGDSGGESYYFRFDCQGDQGGMFRHVTDGSETPPRGGPKQADSWAHFIHCVVGLPHDRADTPGTTPPGTTPPGTPPGTTPPGTPPGTPPTGQRVHVVVAGDYLVKLAQHYYGDGQQWRKIYNANRGVIGPNPDKIFPGQRLVIP